MRADIDSKVDSRASGNMKEALSTIVGPWQTATGWAIGVGDIARVGLPSDAPASRSTIRDFLTWFNRELEEGREAGVVAAQEERVRARERRRRPAAKAVARPVPKPTPPTMAQRQRAIVKAAEERRAAETQKAGDLAKRIKDRWDELRRQRQPSPQAESARMVRASLAQRALGVRQQIRSIRGRTIQNTLARNALRAQLATIRRLLKIMRETG